MKPGVRPIQFVVWSGLVLIILVIVAAFVVEQRKVSRTTASGFPVYGDVVDFSVTNQLGQVVTKANLKGKLWVANIIFSRCPGPCAQMTHQMAELQKTVPADWPVQFITLTTDPEFDSPSVLRKYGERFGADPQRWWFLTGTKKEILRLAVQGLMLTAEEKPEGQRELPDDLFIHSSISVLVDGQGRVRKTLQVLPPDSVEEDAQIAAFKQDSVKEMRAAMEQLLKEGTTK
ncbi:MAG: Cu2+-binding oxygen sensor (SCO1/SenC/PrrC family) [Verrucomicrobia bacterium]|jgi:protein SCO1/2|nr:Cu2+-binding oxygen sensor (SCO1/SenC/PrrC family) [Verrucomicrobiota bacterium]